MTDIQSNLVHLTGQIPKSVTLVAVSKKKPVEDILLAYKSGQRIFGENRVQELLIKKDLLPGDIEWHLIGHLQSNKVRLIVPFISMIQSVDTFRLLKLINTAAASINRTVNCLLQIYIAKEKSKSGFSLDEIEEMLNSAEFADIRNVRICGVMAMATFTDDNDQIRSEFRYLADCFKKLKDVYFSDDPCFKEISMGMSGDYSIAVNEGSTMIRIGSLIFGER